MPRAALLSIHARVEGAHPAVWDDPALVQLWGPRFSVYVVPAQDRALFSLALLPDHARGRRRAEDLAERLRASFGRARVLHSDAREALSLHDANLLRYAAATGTVLIRWDGARQPLIWTVPPPSADPGKARLELARRYLHVYGPADAAAFAKWSGLGPKPAIAVFEAIRGELMPVCTPIGDAWILASDENAMRLAPGPAAPARLLPSGDAFFLLQGPDRELMVPQAERRDSLWTSRV